MAWFHNIFKRSPPPATSTPAPASPVNPVKLAKIEATNADQITQKFSPKPASLPLLQSEPTSGQQGTQLEQHNQSEDAIKSLAHGLPDRESTWYACQSSRRVADKLAPADKEALAASEAWVKNPTPATQAQAAAAAAKTDYQGPGAWSAQAAAWSQSAPGAATPPPAPGMQPVNLTPQAAVGAILLAAAIENNAPMPPPPPKPEFKPHAMPIFQTLQTPPAEAPEPTPLQMAKTAKMHQPYIDLGKDIASGKNTWS